MNLDTGNWCDSTVFVDTGWTQPSWTHAGGNVVVGIASPIAARSDLPGRGQGHNHGHTSASRDVSRNGCCVAHLQTGHYWTQVFSLSSSRINNNRWDSVVIQSVDQDGDRARVHVSTRFAERIGHCLCPHVSSELSDLRLADYEAALGRSASLADNSLLPAVRAVRGGGAL